GGDAGQIHQFGCERRLAGQWARAQYRGVRPLGRAGVDRARQADCVFPGGCAALRAGDRTRTLAREGRRVRIDAGVRPTANDHNGRHGGADAGRGWQSTPGARREQTGAHDQGQADKTVPTERIDYVRSIYGDQCALIDLDELLDLNVSVKEKVRLPETVRLLLV